MNLLILILVITALFSIVYWTGRDIQPREGG